MVARRSPPDNKVLLVSRPGLDVSKTLPGVTSVDFLYSEPGVFENDLFAVSGKQVFRNETLIGEIDGDGPVSMDSFSNISFIAAGQSLFSYNGTTILPVSTPDNSAITKVLIAAGRAVVIKNNSQRFYWSDVLDPIVGDLSFAEAENSPDRLLDMLYVGDTLLLFGEGTTEFWTLNADPDLPFVPIVGRVLPKGIRQLGAVTKINDTFAWVTNDNKVCVSSLSNSISDVDLETSISNSATVRLWTFFLDQTEFLCLSLDDETWVLNPYTEFAWSRFQTYGQNDWSFKCFSNDSFGGTGAGATFVWSSSYVDPDNSVLERRFRVWAPIESGQEILNSVLLNTNPGQTLNLTGDYSNPAIEMRTSRDGGETFSSFRTITVGAQGAYRRLVRWLSCGIFSYPGVMLEFRITDPVPFRVSSVIVNEPLGSF
jgi:Phage stabilisation protein